MPHKAFQGFRQWIYRASRKTWCRDVTWFCHPSRKTWCRDVTWFCHPSQTKRNMKSKSTCVKNNVCSQHGVTWQIDAIGLRKCDLGLPSNLLSWR
jgi:hypothetical protein